MSHNSIARRVNLPDKRVSVWWQEQTKTWFVAGSLGCSRHKTKQPAEAEARERCRDAAADGYVVRLTVRNKNGRIHQQWYP